MADKTPSQESRERYDKNLPLWRPYWKAMTEEERFLDGDRFQHNSDWYNRDRRLIQIRGRETDDTIRHNVAQVTAKPRSIEARPVDTDSDPDQAEVEVALVEQELNNPLKRFQQCFEEAIYDARSIGMGIVWMDWCPEEGPWGELIYSSDDPRRYMWQWAYHPHHLMCDWLIRTHRWDVDYARQIFKQPTLEPDRTATSGGQNFQYGVPLIHAREDLTLLEADDNKITLLECWYKNDRTKGESYKETGQRKLAADQRYMACTNGCGYRSDTQGALQAAGKIKGQLPVERTAGCPQCGGDLERVDTLGMQQPTLAYKNGKRLVITPLFMKLADDQAVYDGAWPIAKLRSYPMFMTTAYLKRGRPRGHSDTSWCWDLQIAADHLDTMAVQRNFEHRTYWNMPENGINNADGKRFEFRDDDYFVMFRDETIDKPLDVTPLQGSGLDPTWPITRSSITTRLAQYRGSTDLGPQQELEQQSGVAIAQRNAIGEIPVAHFKRRVNQDLADFYGVTSDAIHATYPPQRLVRLNIEGVDIVSHMWGQDQPNFDFVIEDTPEFTGLEKARQEAWDAAQGMLLNPMCTPDLLEAWGKFHQAPKSVIRDLVKVFISMRSGGAPGGVPGGPPGPPGGPPPNGPPGGPPPVSVAPVQNAAPGLMSAGMSPGLPA